MKKAEYLLSLKKKNGVSSSLIILEMVACHCLTVL